MALKIDNFTPDSWSQARIVGASCRFSNPDVSTYPTRGSLMTPYSRQCVGDDSSLRGGAGRVLGSAELSDKTGEGNLLIRRLAAI